MKKKIIVAFKTHFDIGFTGLAKEIVAKYGTEMMDSVLRVCEGTAENPKGKRFVWTMSAWPLLQSLENAAPEDRVRAEKLAREGRLVSHALPYTTHTEFMGFEELCRVFSFVKEFSERYSLDFPVSAKMTDVPGHTWFLPTLLSGAGIKFLHLGCNSCCRSPKVPLFFWWEGIDGSRVLTMYNTTYGSSILPPKGWKYPVWLSMQQTNDNIGPQGCGVIDELETRLKESGTDGEIFVGTMDDFYREIAACDLSDLPVVRGDLADSWIHGVGTYPMEVSALRRARSEILALESFAAASGKSDEAFQKTVDDAFAAAQLFGEHTWGLDVKITLGYDRKYKKSEFKTWRENKAPKRMELSWNEQRGRVRDVERGVKKATELVKGEKRVAFNPLARPYDGYTQTAKNEKSFSACGKNYSRLCLNALSSTAFERAAVEADVPTMSETNEEIIAQNACLRLVIDKKSGEIKEFRELAMGRNWLKGKSEYAYDVIGSKRINDFIRDYCSRFSDWVVNDLGRMSYPEDMPSMRFGTRSVKVEAVGAGIRVTFLPTKKSSFTEYGNAEKIEVDFVLLGNRLNVTLKLCAKQATPFVESGSFGFTINAENPNYRINKVGSAVDPKKDIVDNANHAIYCLENFVDVIEADGSGVAIVSRDAPLFSLGKNNVYLYRKKYRAPKETKILFNLFNNAWGTNFPQWMEGDYTYEFDLIPHGEEGAERAVFETVHAPMILDGEETDAPFGLTGAELSAFKAEEDGYLIRIRETKGQAATAVLKGKLFDGVSSVERVDLFGRTKELLAVDGGAVQVNLTGFGFASIKVKRQ